MEPKINKICEHCGKEHLMFTFHCRRCGIITCKDHRIPELHNCPAVQWKITEDYVKHTLNRFQMPKI